MWVALGSLEGSSDLDIFEEVAESTWAAISRGALRLGEWQELPDAIGMSWAPGSVRDETEAQEPIERVVELRASQCEPSRYLLSRVEGGPALVGGQGEVDEYGDGLGAEPREPASMQKVRLEPAKGWLGPPDLFWIRGLRSLRHDFALGFFFARLCDERFFLCSWLSLSR